jgi:hypothetical protein
MIVQLLLWSLEHGAPHLLDYFFQCSTDVTVNHFNFVYFFLDYVIMYQTINWAN